MGRVLYPAADRLLVCADAGGSNGYRVRLWKTELGQVRGRDRACGHGVPLPAGHLQVEQIEHRLFSHISMNWRGRPLSPKR
jgi:hypothetical protein